MYQILNERKYMPAISIPTSFDEVKKIAIDAKNAIIAAACKVASFAKDAFCYVPAKLGMIAKPIDPRRVEDYTKSVSEKSENVETQKNASPEKINGTLDAEEKTLESATVQAAQDPTLDRQETVLNDKATRNIAISNSVTDVANQVFEGASSFANRGMTFVSNKAYNGRDFLYSQATAFYTKASNAGARFLPESEKTEESTSK